MTLEEAEEIYMGFQIGMPPITAGEIDRGKIATAILLIESAARQQEGR